MNTFLILCVALAALLACEASCPARRDKTEGNRGSGVNDSSSISDDDKNSNKDDNNSEDDDNNSDDGDNNSDDGDNNSDDDDNNSDNKQNQKSAESVSGGAAAGKNITDTTWTNTEPDGSTNSVTQVKVGEGVAATGGGSRTSG